MGTPQRKCAFCGRRTSVHPAQIRSTRPPNLPNWSPPPSSKVARLPHHPLRVKGVPAPLCVASLQGAKAQFRVEQEEVA